MNPVMVRTIMCTLSPRYGEAGAGKSRCVCNVSKKHSQCVLQPTSHTDWQKDIAKSNSNVLKLIYSKETWGLR